MDKLLIKETNVTPFSFDVIVQYVNDPLAPGPATGRVWFDAAINSEHHAETTLLSMRLAKLIDQLDMIKAFGKKKLEVEIRGGEALQFYWNSLIEGVTQKKKEKRSRN